MEMGLPTFPYAIYKTNQLSQSSPPASEKGCRGMRKRSRKRPFVLDDRHKLAAQIFAQGDFGTMQEVASRVGVCRQTLWRWWRNPAFKRYCERVRRAAVAEAMPHHRARIKALVRPIVREMHKAEMRELRERERRLAAEYSAEKNPIKD